MATIDMAGALARKYNILQQQADTAESEARTKDRLADAQAGYYGAHGVSALMSGRAALTSADTSAALAAIQGDTMRSNALLAQQGAPSEIEARQAQAAAARGQASLSTEQARAAAAGNDPNSQQSLWLAALLGQRLGSVGTFDITKHATSDGSFVTTTNAPVGAGGFGDGSTPTVRTVPQSTIAPSAWPSEARRQGRFTTFGGDTTVPGFSNGTEKVQQYKGGATKVPGKGSGKVDTVPAMLAPGEAVLNKEAAEHLGRDTIELLNQLGLMKRGDAPAAGKGSTAASEAPDGVEGHADGVSSVGGRIAGTPAGTSTQDMQALGGISQPVARLWSPQVLTAPAGLQSFADGTSDVRMTYGMDDNGVKLRGPRAEPSHGYAKGTAKVPGRGVVRGVKGKAKPKIDPKLIAAVLNMGGGDSQAGMLGNGHGGLPGLG